MQFKHTCPIVVGLRAKLPLLSSRSSRMPRAA
jgi:hypothetical protein